MKQGETKSVYLAGPMVFRSDAEQVFAEMKAILANLGLRGVAPVDNQAHLQGIAQGAALNRAIYEADVEIMRSVDAAIFDLTPFRRATEMDSGTAFEAGYCRCLDIPMAGWTTERRHYPELVKEYFEDRYGQALAASDLAGDGAKSGLLRDPDGMLVHSEGLYQNLMIEAGIEAAGGAVFANTNWRIAFGKAAEHLAVLFKSPQRNARLVKA